MPAKIIDFDLDLDHVRLPGIDFYPKLQQLYFHLKNCSARFRFFFFRSGANSILWKIDKH